jgi:hypothetical protein
MHACGAREALRAQLTSMWASRSKTYGIDINAQEERQRLVMTLVPTDWAAEWLRPITPDFKMVRGWDHQSCLRHFFPPWLCKFKRNVRVSLITGGPHPGPARQAPARRLGGQYFLAVPVLAAMLCAHEPAVDTITID